MVCISFGRSPEGVQRRDTLLALGRFPVGDGRGGKAGLVDALASDLQMDHLFDPLSADWSAVWTVPRPDVLAAGQRCTVAAQRRYARTAGVAGQ